MEEKLSDTMVKIQQAALEEFSDKGFLGASLRQIVKNAGVTTGHFTDISPAKRLCSHPLWNRMPPLSWADLWKHRSALPSCPRRSSPDIWVKLPATM